VEASLASGAQASTPGQGVAAQELELEFEAFLAAREEARRKGERPMEQLLERARAAVAATAAGGDRSSLRLPGASPGNAQA